MALTQNASLFDGESVLGRPPMFTQTADPHRRVFLDMMNPPPIISIVPGLPDFSQLDDLGEEVKQEISNLDALSNDDTSVLERIYKTMEENAKEHDTRFFKFRTATDEYTDIAVALISRISARMAGFSYDSVIKAAGWGGFSFYADKSSSITESGSNEYGESMLEGMANKGSDLAREMHSIVDTAFRSGSKDPAVQAQEREESKRNIVDSVLGGRFAGDKAATVLRGDKILFPQIWQNSEFTRNYSIAFRFESAYGDPESIFRDVMVPYAAILALALPRQSAAMGYAAPFLVKMDAPGWFSVDSGIITGISIKKGSDESSWTETGLCRSIEVNIDVTDIYPALMLSSTHTALAGNFGMATYLDNLAGLDYTRLGENGTLGQKMMGYINSAGMNLSIAPSVARSKVQEYFDTFTPNWTR